MKKLSCLDLEIRLAPFFISPLCFSMCLRFLCHSNQIFLTDDFKMESHHQHKHPSLPPRHFTAMPLLPRLHATPPPRQTATPPLPQSAQLPPRQFAIMPVRHCHCVSLPVCHTATKPAYDTAITPAFHTAAAPVYILSPISV